MVSPATIQTGALRQPKAERLGLCWPRPAKYGQNLSLYLGRAYAPFFLAPRGGGSDPGMIDCDYLIIDAGPAGWVLANWLSDDPATRVALVEAGPCDWHHIPIPATCLFLQPDRGSTGCS
jgi:hypothetical protein